MGDLHFIVKVRFSEETGEMKLVDFADCPYKTGLPNICVGSNGARCIHMLETPAAIKKSDRHFMIHCGYK